MRRREFGTFLGGVAAAVTGWSSVLVAQQKTLPVIAFLNSGTVDASASKALMTLTEAGLREIGLVQGRDYVF